MRRAGYDDVIAIVPFGPHALHSFPQNYLGRVHDVQGQTTAANSPV